MVQVLVVRPGLVHLLLGSNCVVWYALKGKILSRVCPSRRGFLNQDSDLSCILCGFPEEDTDHLF